MNKDKPPKHTANREDRHNLREDEAKRALKRVDAESETLGTSSFARTANKAKEHFGAADSDQTDPMEIWGTRIGRIGGAIFAIILVIWLFNHFTR